jgi:hypothetical protein
LLRRSVGVVILHVRLPKVNIACAHNWRGAATALPPLRSHPPPCPTALPPPSLPPCTPTALAPPGAGCLSWGFNRNSPISAYLSAAQLVADLTQTVAHGGNLLLNVAPAADGSIPAIFQVTALC